MKDRITMLDGDAWTTIQTRELADLRTQLATQSQEIARLREAADFARMTLNHAMALDYLGEGSTRGMAVDAVAKLDAVLGAEDDRAAGEGV